MQRKLIILQIIICAAPIGFTVTLFLLILLGNIHFDAPIPGTVYIIWMKILTELQISPRCKVLFNIK